MNFGNFIVTSLPDIENFIKNPKHSCFLVQCALTASGTHCCTF